MTYNSLVFACVRPHLFFTVPDDTSGEIYAEFKVELLPNGKQAAAPKLITPSGLPGYDDAALRAIAHCDPFPSGDNNVLVLRMYPVESSPDKSTVANCPKPPYPPAAISEGKEGTTRLKFYLDSTGAVTRSEVLSSSGSSILDRAAQASVLSCHFRPKILDGIAVPTSAEIDYVWRVP